MIESPSIQSKQAQSLYIRRKFPLLSTVQKVHEHNLHVAQVCRQTSQHSTKEYHKSQQHFKKITLENYQAHISNAANISHQRKKILEDRRTNAEKRTSENVLKFQRFLEKKREDNVQKQKNMMEKSAIRRKQYMKSLNNSCHRSSNKLHHIDERKKEEMNRSLILFTNHNAKLEAANLKREENIIQIKEVLSEKNGMVESAQQCWHKGNDKKQKDYIKQLVSKFEKAENRLTDKKFHLAEWISKKRKSEQKVQQKLLKKKSMMYDNRENKRQQESKRSQQKIEKAVRGKITRLTAITNNLESKRKEKEACLKTVAASRMKEIQQKVNYFNQKHQFSSSVLQAYKQERQSLRSQNLMDSYAATHSK